jgi:hypothetical protein
MAAVQVVVEQEGVQVPLDFLGADVSGLAAGTVDGDDHVGAQRGRAGINPGPVPSGRPG